MTDPRARDVLTFWFDETSPKQWFKSDPAFDEVIRERFGAVHEEAAAGHCEGWLETGEGALALVILLDQFSRNLYRGDARAFAQDQNARDCADRALEKGHDIVCRDDRRAFFYMPYMHAEDLEIQEKCIALIRERLGEDSGNVPYAIWHRDLIQEYGRFPFRNKALGRESTPEEIAYLNKKNTSG